MKRFSMIAAAILLPLALSCASTSQGRPDGAPSGGWSGGAVPFSLGIPRTEFGVQVQDLTYTSDGLSVKGYLFTSMSPLSVLRPGVVFSHGGVSGVSKDMVRRAADLARAGYIVITPAYRGEGGSEGRVEVAAGEVNDVLNAAEILRRNPMVDPARLALIGSSHGALVSVLAAARDPRFLAVVEACGVMDVEAWYHYLVENGFDVSDSLSRAVYGYGPEDKPEAFRIRNAILVAPRFKPPLLLQQGLADKTVPPDQPWRLASALDRAGHRGHKVLTYPLLGHAFWFYDNPRTHTTAELEQAEQSWNDMLAFLKAHLKSGLEDSTRIMTPEIPEIQGGAGAGQGGDSSAQGAVGAAQTPPADYEAQIHDWQKKRVERLLAGDGWLTVAGLFWLKEGENSFGSDAKNDIVLPTNSSPGLAGSFVMNGDSVYVQVAPKARITVDGRPVTDTMKLTSDADGKPEVLSLGDLRLFLIKRSKGYAIRMRDLNAPARKNFAGIETFPVDSSWRIDARFVPYNPPKPVEIPSIIGTVDTMLSPGYVEFERDGRSFRLDPVLESDDADELFFIFKDLTSGPETYPPGRFLYSPLPADGRVLLDFNRAYNPPCAFTAFATCPLPPEQNVLALRITAGEKKYAGGEH